MLGHEKDRGHEKSRGDACGCVLVVGSMTCRRLGGQGLGDGGGRCTTRLFVNAVEPQHRQCLEAATMCFARGDGGILVVLVG